MKNNIYDDYINLKIKEKSYITEITYGNDKKYMCDIMKIYENMKSNKIYSKKSFYCNISIY